MRIQDAAYRVLDTLERLGIDYMLVGSLSSMFYSFPRSTSDVDFLIGTSDFDIREFARQLGSEFRLDQQLAFEVFGGSLKHELTIEGTVFRIELFRLTDTPFDRARFDRRKRISLDGHPAWIPTAEDVILQKLIWNRAKDRIDVVAVLDSERSTLDREYLDLWCERLGVTELCQQLWTESLR